MANNQPETQILIQTPPTYSQINSYSKIVKPTTVKYNTLIIKENILNVILKHEIYRILKNVKIKMLNFIVVSFYPEKIWNFLANTLPLILISPTKRCTQEKGSQLLGHIRPTSLASTWLLTKMHSNWESAIPTKNIKKLCY